MTSQYEILAFFYSEKNQDTYPRHCAKFSKKCAKSANFALDDRFYGHLAPACYGTEKLLFHAVARAQPDTGCPHSNFFQAGNRYIFRWKNYFAFHQRQRFMSIFSLTLRWTHDNPVYIKLRSNAILKFLFKNPFEAGNQP